MAKDDTKWKFKLGQKVRDKVTSYAGIIHGRTEWLYGCKRYTVQSQDLKDGKPIEAFGFDEDALELVEETKHTAAHKPAQTGGPETRQPSRPPSAK